MQPWEGPTLCMPYVFDLNTQIHTRISDFILKRKKNDILAHHNHEEAHNDKIELQLTQWGQLKQL